MWVRGYLAGGAFRLGDRALVSEGEDFDLQREVRPEGIAKV
jgi:hypothetical protein